MSTKDAAGTRPGEIDKPANAIDWVDAGWQAGTLLGYRPAAGCAIASTANL